MFNGIMGRMREIDLLNSGLWLVNQTCQPLNPLLPPGAAGTQMFADAVVLYLPCTEYGAMRTGYGGAMSNQSVPLGLDDKTCFTATVN